MTNEELFTLHRGIAPLLVSLPHVGTVLPGELRPRLVERAGETEDADWHLERLYGFARRLGASVLVPKLSRYAIDLNRPPENAPMYPGANNTELCPTRFFTGEPLYRDGQQPGEAEVQQRLAHWWRPYHDALAAELARIRGQHGHVVLFDGHSIKGELPWLFDGALPDMNVGTASGASCAASLRAQVGEVFAAQSRYSHVLDGRFKGGYITRRYGAPATGVHAVQLEMAWRAYMVEARPYAWDDERAAQVTPLLQRLVEVLIAWQP